MKCLPAIICAKAASPARFARGTETRRDLTQPAWLITRFKALNPFHARAGNAYEKHRGLSHVEVLEEVLDIARIEQVNAADDVEVWSSPVPTSHEQ